MPFGSEHQGKLDPNVTNEERELLRRCLDPKWFRGKSFEGTSQEDAKRQHIQYYAELCGLLDCDWPTFEGGDSALLKCQICGCTTPEFEAGTPHTLLQDNPFGFVTSPGSCRLQSWGIETPHVAHRECYIAGYLDSMLMTSGMSMSSNVVRYMPSCIDKRKLLDLFDVIVVSDAEVQETGTSERGGVRLRLKDPPSACCFCSSLGISDASLEKMRDLGFRRLSDSPQTVLSLINSGSFSPFPVGGTIIARPCFDPIKHATEILKHAVPGTFVDFDGYRCSHLCVVVDDVEAPVLSEGSDASSVSHLTCFYGESDDDDDEEEEEDNRDNKRRNKFRVVARARVDSRRYLRLRMDDAGYAVVPHGVVRFHGLPKLSRWPPDLTRTLLWLCLTDYDLYLAGEGEHEDNIISSVKDIDGSIYPVLSPPLQETDALTEKILRYKQWLQEKMAEQPEEEKDEEMEEGTPPTPAFSGFGGAGLFGGPAMQGGGGSSTPSQRREWCQTELQSLERIIHILQGILRDARGTGRVAPTAEGGNPPTGTFLSLATVRQQASDLKQVLDAPDGPRGRFIWGVEEEKAGEEAVHKAAPSVVPPEWKTETLEAFGEFVESRLAQVDVLPSSPGETMDFRVDSRDRSRWPPEKDEERIFETLLLSSVAKMNPNVGRDGWVRNVPVISAEHCRRVGYSTLLNAIALRGDDGVYALELGDLSSYSCSQHFLAFAVPSDSKTSATCQLAHSATLSREEEQHLQELEAVCVEALQAATEQVLDAQEEEEKNLYSKYQEFCSKVAEEFKSRAGNGNDDNDNIEVRLPLCTTCGQEVPVSFAISTVKNSWDYYKRYGSQGTSGGINFFDRPRPLEGQDYEGLDNEASE